MISVSTHDSALVIEDPPKMACTGPGAVPESLTMGVSTTVLCRAQSSSPSAWRGMPLRDLLTRATSSSGRV